MQDVTEHLEGLPANYLRLHVSGDIQEMSKHRVYVSHKSTRQAWWKCLPLLA